MTREALEKLIDDDMVAAFVAMDQLDWRGYQGSYQELKEKWVDLPQGSSKSSFRSQLKILLGLHFGAQLQPTFPETHLLTPPPFIPEIFLGRDSDLAAVYHKLFQEENLLLLVNGQGGIGKTTLAAKYWERYKSQYSHVAWVFAGDDLAQALLALAPKLKLSFPETMPNAERLPLLIQELCALDKPCLLIIDNANNLAELEKHYLALRSCANFHILLTSRITEFEQAARHAIQPLEQEQALELFQRHYPKYQASEEVLLLQIFKAVGYNTLVIELLAKNLRNLNKLREQYSLQQLLQDLQSKGLLSITKSSSVNTGYQAQGGALRQASPEAIITAMYELGDLPEIEKQLLSVFAVLPAERIELVMLELLLSTLSLDEPLSHLALLGWLDFEEQDVSFKISPVVQQIVREQNRANLKTDCKVLIHSLIKQLNWETYGHYADYPLMDKLSNYATNLILCFQDLDNDIAILCQRIGDYYRVTGNLNAAMQYFEQYHSMTKQLFKKYPQEAYYIDSLAISYERVGDTHMELGNLPLALGFFEERNRIAKELYKAYPQNVSYKNNLAISYQFLGNTHHELGNLLQALSFFEQYHLLEKELYLASPQNVNYKGNLAISASKLGDMHSELSDLPQALSFFEQYNTLAKELNSAFPQNVGYKNILAISYSRLGQTHSDLGNLPQALSFFEQFNEIEKELHLAFPQNLGYKYNLAISYSKLGMVHLQQNNLPQASQTLDRYRTLGVEVYHTAPENASYHSNYAESIAVNAGLHKFGGLDSSKELTTAAQLLETLYQKSPRDYFQKKLAVIRQIQAAEGDALKELIIALVKF